MHKDQFMLATVSHTLVVANASPLRNAFISWVRSIPGEHVVTSTDDAAVALAVVAYQDIDVMVVDAALPAPAQRILLHHAYAGDPSLRVVMLNTAEAVV
jgi:DNA-binding NarL/FixJ family response regulator